MAAPVWRPGVGPIPPPAPPVFVGPYVPTPARVSLVSGAAGPAPALPVWLCLALLTLGFSACGGGEDLVSSESPLAPIDSVPPPGDSVPLPAPPDSIIPPPPAVDSPPAPGPDTLTPPPPAPDTTPLPPVEHRGIAFGPFHLPPDQYGPEFSGTLRSTTSKLVLADLQAARRAGARVLLSLGGQRVLRDAKGHFSLALWKQRMDRYRGIDLSAYIADGTLLGHYIMDEPHDFSNWGGTQVTVDQIEEMAKYSKEIWPNLPTVIRAWPDYLQGRTFRYLDAAWAQYSPGNGASRYRIPMDDFIRKNVSEAKAAGLRLVVGLNMLGGSDSRGLRGYDGSRWSMSASQVKTWGSALLEVEGSCAFLSWKYDKAYFGRADIKEALAELGEKASKLPKKSCHR